MGARIPNRNLGNIILRFFSNRYGVDGTGLDIAMDMSQTDSKEYE